MVARPGSLNTVGTFTEAPLTCASTSVRTSENSWLLNSCGLAPDAPSSLSICRYAGDRPMRVRSLAHDTLSSARSATASSPTLPNIKGFVIVVSTALLPGDPRGDEDQQFAALLVDDVLLEEPAKQRHAVQHR